MKLAFLPLRIQRQLASLGIKCILLNAAGILKGDKTAGKKL
jgi:hypothetical protein